MKVYVAGHTGLVGQATMRALKAAGHKTWTPLLRFDLTQREPTRDVFKYAVNAGVDAVVLAAARVGGIGANSAFPIQFLHDNLAITMNVITEAARHGIDRLVNLGSSCIYPRDVEQPMREEALLTGPLEPTNEAYAIAKIAGLKLVQAYRCQQHRRYISLMPTNLYGDGDTYDPQGSHVIPALIFKFEQARRTKASFVDLWGTGSPMREFLHADDLARALVLALEEYDDDLWLNVGSEDEITIRDLASMIENLTGYSGTIRWDVSKPNGTPRKKLDCSRMRALGWAPKISLEEGLLRSIEDYRERFGAV